ncbi:putative efflux pump membrane fusion protein [Rodentibacter pneumotropicus]|uniref:Putative efflux pump membrane fusion protein n=1 Tax=Rodentibacter pneumotropicus TaxID=758 RepID=A0A448MJC6_9PAST|nr:putative efflux pump membrane fusion protein [Rodentibacter pneumotropicus]
MDPGIIQEMKVKEGEIVEKGQVLLTLDDTRSSAILRESEAKVQNLRAVVARLQAESAGKPLVFADDIPEDVVSRETAAYNARRKAMLDAVEGLAQSKALLDKEIAITQPMVKKE